MPMEFNRWTFFGSLFESVVARQINTLPKALELIESSQFTQYSEKAVGIAFDRADGHTSSSFGPSIPDGEIDTQVVSSWAREYGCDSRIMEAIRDRWNRWLADPLEPDNQPFCRIMISAMRTARIPKNLRYSLALAELPLTVDSTTPATSNSVDGRAVVLSSLVSGFHQ